MQYDWVDQGSGAGITRAQEHLLTREYQEARRARGDRPMISLSWPEMPVFRLVMTPEGRRVAIPGLLMK